MGCIAAAFVPAQPACRGASSGPASARRLREQPQCCLTDLLGSSAESCAAAPPAMRNAPAARGWADTLRGSALSLAAAGMLLLGDSQLALAENELADLAGGEFHSELVNPECFATSCKAATTACAENRDCTKGLACTAKCMGDAQCTVGCFARYGNKDLDNMLQCSIEDAACIKIAIMEPGGDGPLTAPLPPKALVKATPASMGGKWYKVLGFNPNYDCFDCQRNTFEAQKARPASNTRVEGAPQGREIAIDVGSTGVDVEVEYAMPRTRIDQAPQTFRSTLHETLQFDNTPGSRRTAHTEGKMFGLTFWENWYVIGANKVNEPQFRFVYYTGKTLQNRYEGAFVYSRTPELPRDAMPSIYKIAREAGMDPTRFCCVDNKCFSGEQSAQAPLFTPVAEAAESLPSTAAPGRSALDILPPSLRRVVVDAAEYLEDPRPASVELFGKQRQMVQVREFDANGYRVPLDRIN
uniref:VDE lipocalin domain-containing protein n=1 Tax=Haptolina ericina TaxID=156174 RepID=A0A7S3APN8_9EUKA